MTAIPVTAQDFAASPVDSDLQVALSLALVPLGVAGIPYAITASVLGAGVLAQGWSGWRTGDLKWARQVFLASIVYLPLLFGVMVLGGRPA